MCKGEAIKPYMEKARGYLSDYIKIDTSNPPGNYEEAVSFWMHIYEKEAIRYQIYTHESGNQSICGFVVENGANPSVLLLNHMDVVPADTTDWEFPPFDGVDDGEYIYGRGAIDMKGLAVIQLAAALYARDLNRNEKLKRNIIILSVPDEELGGFKGAKFVTEKYLPQLNPEVVLDEGAFGIKGESGRAVYVSYSQKKSLWLRLYARGRQGHAAHPSEDNANNILLRALEPFINNPLREADDKSELMDHAKLSDRNAMSGLFQTLFYNTISVTSICSKSAVNVKPGEAEAVLDCRLTPGTNVEAYIKRLQDEIQDGRIRIEVIKRTDEIEKSDVGHKILDVMGKAVGRYIRHGNVVPIVSPVGTDSKYFRAKGVQSYGFFPILLEKNELAIMHGTNEKISLENLCLGIEIMAEVVTNYAKGE